jgi:hypothetical protein
VKMKECSAPKMDRHWESGINESSKEQINQ